MKKLAIVFVIILIVVSLFSFTLVASAETDVNNDAKYYSYNIYEEYSKQFRDRSSGSFGETNAANYISQSLSGLGYTGLNGSNDYLQTFTKKVSLQNPTTYDYEEKSVSSKNVIAYKRCGVDDAKLLVIGCSYGNAYGYNDIKNEGAYESSSSVATLLSIAKGLRTTTLDFDIAFAFFGGEAYSYMGTQNFLSLNKQSILGYINLDGIAGGNDLYIFYDDVKTAHGELIDGVISKFGYDVKGAPFNKSLYSIESDRPYFHKGLHSSAYLFMEKDLPIVHIFGYNWVAFSASESTKHDNIIGTENDTFEYMNEKYGKEAITERLNLATNLVTTTVLQNKDLATAFEKYDNSYTALYSDGVYYGVIVGMIALVIILFIVGYSLASKKTQKVGNPDFATNSTFLNGNASYQERKELKQEDDVFGFDNDPIITDSNNTNTQENSSGNSDDDIFGEF